MSDGVSREVGPNISPEVGQQLKLLKQLESDADQIARKHTEDSDFEFFREANQRQQDITSLLRAHETGTVLTDDLARWLAFSFQDLKSSVDKDPLTQLDNSRSIRSKISKEIELTRSGNQPLTVGFLDFDNFKQYNSAFQHVTTNKVLEALKGHFSNYNLPWEAMGRFGGDEFIILMPGASSEDSIETYSRILKGLPELVINTLKSSGINDPEQALRSEIHKSGKELKPEESPFTFSAGLAQLREADDTESLIARANRNVMLAKEAGKMRVFDDKRAEQYQMLLANS